MDARTLGWESPTEFSGKHHRMRLHCRPPAQAGATTLLALHGFTGGGLDFALPAAMDQGRYAWIAPDLPGHGNTPTLSLDAWLADLGSWLRSDAPPNPVLLGYSMGGRIALHAGLRFPDLFAKVIVIGANPGIQDPELREQRRHADLQRANRLRQHGVELFLREWRQEPLIATQNRIASPWREQLDRIRSKHHAEGLANALLTYGPTEIPLPCPPGFRFPKPLWFLAGAEDPRYCALGRRLHEDRFCHGFAVVPDAGHAAHLENPAGFLSQLMHMLA